MLKEEKKKKNNDGDSVDKDDKSILPPTLLVYLKLGDSTGGIVCRL